MRSFLVEMLPLHAALLHAMRVPLAVSAARVVSCDDETPSSLVMAAALLLSVALPTALLMWACGADSRARGALPTGWSARLGLLSTVAVIAVISGPGPASEKEHSLGPFTVLFAVLAVLFSEVFTHIMWHSWQTLSPQLATHVRLRALLLMCVHVLVLMPETQVSSMFQVLTALMLFAGLTALAMASPTLRGRVPVWIQELLSMAAINLGLQLGENSNIEVANCARRLGAAALGATVAGPGDFETFHQGLKEDQKQLLEAAASILKENLHTAASLGPAAAEVSEDWAMEAINKQKAARRCIKTCSRGLGTEERVLNQADEDAWTSWTQDLVRSASARTASTEPQSPPPLTQSQSCPERAAKGRLAASKHLFDSNDSGAALSESRSTRSAKARLAAAKVHFDSNDSIPGIRDLDAAEGLPSADDVLCTKIQAIAEVAEGSDNGPTIPVYHSSISRSSKEPINGEHPEPRERGVSPDEAVPQAEWANDVSALSNDFSPLLDPRTFGSSNSRDSGDSFDSGFSETSTISEEPPREDDDRWAKFQERKANRHLKKAEKLANERRRREASEYLQQAISNGSLDSLCRQLVRSTRENGTSPKAAEASGRTASGPLPHTLDSVGFQPPTHYTLRREHSFSSLPNQADEDDDLGDGGFVDTASYRSWTN